MALIIRDDDLSAWSTVTEVETVYRPLFERGIRVSFAVVPFAVRMYNPGSFEHFYQDPDSERALGENPELVDYLRRRIDEGLVEIMLHGYNHLYTVESQGIVLPASRENLRKARLQKKVRYVGEYAWENPENLQMKTTEGKQYLENLLGISVHNFVPPSNQISREGVKAIIREGMNLSGLIGRHYDRELTCRGVCTYFDRVLFALRHPDLIYPRVADYGRHLELAGYALTPNTDNAAYERQMVYCREYNFPFQLATHYWELKGDLRRRFYALVDRALKMGFESKFLREVLV